MKSWLEKNDIETYSTHNEGKSIVAERFIKTLKDKVYKHMTAVSKNVYIDNLDDIGDEYKNTYQRTIKMKPVDVKSGNYIEYALNSNDKDPKFQVDDNVRISKYESIFSKEYTPNFSEEVFLIMEVKNTVPWKYIISDLNGEEISGRFYENELQKTNQLRIEKVIKKKVDKLYVKWK